MTCLAVYYKSPKETMQCVQVFPQHAHVALGLQKKDPVTR